MSIHLDNGKKVKDVFVAVPLRRVSEFHLFGKLTQTGTPAPKAPCSLVIAGSNGSIPIMHDGSTIATIPTEGGLAAIPASSNGTYTDSNGKRWVSDEIVIYEDGTVEKIKRVDVRQLKVIKDNYGESANGITIRIEIGKWSNGNELICSHFPKALSNMNRYNNTIGLGGDANKNCAQISLSSEIATTQNQASEFFASNNVMIAYTLAEPIVTRYSPSDSFAKELEKIRNVYPVKSITNSVGCDMYMEFNEQSITKKKIRSIWVNHEGVPKKVFSGASMLVIVGDDGLSYSTTDMVNWRQMTGADTTLNCVTYGKDRFVAVGNNGKSYYSTDGKEWKPMGEFTSELTTKFTHVIYANKMFVALGETHIIFYSTDGETWKQSTNLLSSGYPVGIAYGKAEGSGNKFVVITDTGASYYSTTGKTWVAGGYLDMISNFKSIAYGNGRFLAISDEGRSYFSKNGETWTKVGNLYSSNINPKHMIYANYTFVGVGSGYIRTGGAVNESSIWTSGSINGTNHECVTFGNGKFTVVHGRGQILTSLNGKDWEFAFNDRNKTFPTNSMCFSVDGGHDDDKKVIM